jgi:lycopene cyclase domain-containing protein
MTYSDLAIYAVLLAVMLDLYIIKSQMLTRGIYWLTWALILPFQLLTNSWLTTNEIVIYSPEQIIGRRLAGAPVEDLLFGFSMILLTLSLWERFKPRDTTSNKEESKPGQEIER